MELWFNEARNGGGPNPFGFTDYNHVTILTDAERKWIRGVIDGTITPVAYLIMPERPNPNGLSRTHSYLHRHPMFTPLFSYLWSNQPTEIIQDWEGNNRIYNKYTPYQSFYTKFPNHETVMLTNAMVNSTEPSYTLIESPPITMNRIALFLPANVFVRVRYQVAWKGSLLYAVADMEQGHLMKYNLYDPEFVDFLTPKEEFAFRLKHVCGT